MGVLGPSLEEVLKHSISHIPAEGLGTRPHLLLQPSGRPLEPASSLYADKSKLRYLPAGRGQVHVDGFGACRVRLKGPGVSWSWSMSLGDMRVGVVTGTAGWAVCFVWK